MSSIHTLAAVAAIIAGGIALYQFAFDRDEADAGPLRIAQVNSAHPDFLELAPRGDSTVNVGDHHICEHDPEGRDENCCTLGPDLQIKPGERLRVWFFSPKKPERRQEAEEYRQRGEVVCATSGISTGEIVRLLSPSGQVLAETRAP